MAQISNKTLEYISGEYGVNTSTQLLDNTIATMTHKMNQKSQKQLGDLRNMQIKQAMNEQAEYEKNAYNRDLERQLLTKRNEHAVKNAEETLELQQQTLRSQERKVFEEGQNSSVEILLNSNDPASFEKELEKGYAAGHFNEAFVEKYKGSDPSNPAVRTQIQNELYPDYESWLALEKERIKAASSGGTPRKATFNFENTKAVLKNSGISTLATPEVTSIIQGIVHKYNQYDESVQASDIESIAIGLLKRNEDKYISSSGFATWEKANVDKQALENDIIAVKETGFTADQWAAHVEKNRKLGYTEAELLADLKRQQARR